MEMLALHELYDIDVNNRKGGGQIRCQNAVVRKAAT
jgi:hypothetical protein